MIHLFWNCRGLGSDTVVRALHGQIREHRPSMIFLSETKMKDHRIAGVRRRLGYSNGFDVAPVGIAGGLSLWWDDSIMVEVKGFSRYYIDASCNVVDSQTIFRFTGIYGTSYRAEKEVFWRNLIQSFSPEGTPWICGGDFNEFLWSHEKMGGAEVRYNRPRYLEEFMQKTELSDLGCKGQNFTWRGMRNGQLVEARLDRCLVNLSWQSRWPNTFITNCTSLASDHCPVLMRCEAKPRRMKKLFRFEAFWTKDGDCKDIVRDAWTYGRGRGPLDRWNFKLNLCRNKLIRWSNDKFMRRGNQLRVLMSHLEILQHNWRVNAEEIVEVSKKVDLLRCQEESFWLQRSRVQWLKEGDANTRFFHQSTLNRRRRNSVVSLKDNSGALVDNLNSVRKLVDEHFVKLYTSSGPRDWGDILGCIIPKVTDDMNATLSGPVSAEEVKAAVMDMGGLKAPGPDGFSGIFYHSHWEILAADVNEFVEVLIQGVEVPRQLNATHLVLIPKTLNPDSVSQFRPISLCNYSYKVLSKVLANRLKVFIPELISSTQNAFVAGRLIQDNIGIAHELFHFLKTRRTKKKFELAVKLDMEKAYDRVEWDFLVAVMERLGFDSRWRALILGCVSSVNFSILLNGQPGSKFAPSRGLRQGDPLSPFLFLFVSEVLSLLIQKASDRKLIKGVRISPSGPSISHILFADDTLIFLKAEVENCRNLINVINEYCVASGQRVNMTKSSVFFGANVPDALSVQLCDILGMEMTGDPGVYLGVPAIWGRSKKCGLAYVKGRLMGKLNGWKKSSLSQAGREVLIKAVAQAIPAYPMNLFKFPSSLCKEMDAMVTKFWWGQMKGENRIHWVSREMLGRAKQDGGLGLRNFEAFNDALLAKQCWRIINEPNSLWARVLKARYFPKVSFLDANLGGRASWAWSSLLAGRDLLLKGAHWQIMSGKGVRVWVDRWLPETPVGRPVPLGTAQVSRNLSVNSLICPDSGDWDIDFLKPFLTTEAFNAILETHIGDNALLDRLVWPFDKRGVYSVKSGYHWAHMHAQPLGNRPNSIPSEIWKFIWQLKIPPKLRCFLWKTLNGALATMANLYQRRSSSSPLCPICGVGNETITHLLLQCSWVRGIWFGGCLNFRSNQLDASSWACWLSQMFVSVRGSKEVSRHIFFYISFTCWHIWIARCNFLFNHQQIHPPRILEAISRSALAFIDATSIPASPTVPCPLIDISPAVWSLPAVGVVKINVDGSWLPRDGSGFLGVVARDYGGGFLAACRYCVKASSVAMVEAMAVMFGCRLGLQRGWNSVILESDSLETISCLKDVSSKGSWEAFPFIAKCRNLGKVFLECRWSWVPRSANRVADLLASRSCKEVCDLVWVDRPPSSLIHVLCNDGLPCPH